VEIISSSWNVCCRYSQSPSAFPSFGGIPTFSLSFWAEISHMSTSNRGDKGQRELIQAAVSGWPAGRALPS
jgi:hypothetical protein